MQGTSRRNVRAVLPFAFAATLAYVSILVLPTPGEREGLVLPSGLVTAALVIAAIVLATQNASRRAGVILTMAYLPAVALLREAEGGASSGLSPLFLLPVLWIALNGTRVELGVSIGIAAAMLLIPTIFEGGPRYPTEEYRRTVILVITAGFLGFTVHTLVTRVRDQVARLTEAERVKDEFFSLISHELRTPLTSIIGYTEELLDDEDADPLTDTQRKFLDVVQRNGLRLLELVNELLFIARAQAGKIELSKREIDIRDLAEQCVDTARPHAHTRSIELSLDIEPDIPAVEADRSKLGQAFDNLISNAIKYTPEGGRVDVRVFHEQGSAVLEITDTGVGIPKDEQERLFEQFFRASTATDRSIQGIGLGLHITKLIAEGHGGAITVKSEEGVGSTFCIQVPVAPNASANSLP